MDDETVQAHVVSRLMMSKCIGGKHLPITTLMQGALSQVPSGDVVRATKALYDRGWLMRHSKGSLGGTEHVSLNARTLTTSIPWAAERLPKEVADRIYAKVPHLDDDDDLGDAPPPAPNTGTGPPEAPSNGDYIPRPVHERHMRDLNARISSLEARLTRIIGEDRGAHDHDVNQLLDRIKSLEDARGSMRESIDKAHANHDALKSHFKHEMLKVQRVVEDGLERVRSTVLERETQLPPARPCAMCDSPAYTQRPVHIWRGGATRQHPSPMPLCLEHDANGIIYFSNHDRSAARRIAKDLIAKGYDTILVMGFQGEFHPLSKYLQDEGVHVIEQAFTLDGPS